MTTISERNNDVSTAGLWEEPEDTEAQQPSKVREFRSKPRLVSMVQWDGSDEAADLIARHGGQHCRRVPLCRDGNRLEIWWKRSARYVWLEVGDWVAIDPDGGVYPVGEFEHGDLFEVSPEAGARGGAGLWNDDGWEAPRGAEGALG